MDSERAEILIVDDEPAVTALFKVVLEEAGHVCHTANSGKSALAVLFSKRVDLVLLDILMPDMTALSLFQNIKAKFPRLPVIIISALADLETAVDFLKDGAFDYLAKPLTNAELRKSVEEALKKRTPVPD